MPGARCSLAPDAGPPPPLCGDQIPPSPPPAPGTTLCRVFVCRVPGRGPGRGPGGINVCGGGQCFIIKTELGTAAPLQPAPGTAAPRFYRHRAAPRHHHVFAPHRPRTTQHHQQWCNAGHWTLTHTAALLLTSNFGRFMFQRQRGQFLFKLF